MSPSELEKVWSRNVDTPPAVDRCVHHLILGQLLARPDAEAISSWDGNLTYRELDDLATRLSQHLTVLDVGPEVIVPICFEKTLWVVVAMLAVLKSGAAFVPLDASQSPERRERILCQTKARVMLASVQNSDAVAVFDGVVVTVGPDTMPTPRQPRDAIPQVSPDSMAYVLFTSGSTGQPNGVVKHRAVSSSCSAHGSRLGFGVETRTLQFSYTFDGAIVDIMTTLIFGCICIPSDSQRLDDVSRAINDMAVNLAVLTPSVSRLVSPNDVPTLKVMILGCEAPTDNDFSRWESSAVPVINGYGPTECTVFCALNDTSISKRYGCHIGSPVGSNAWLVSPEDHDKLVPTGAIRELLVEGPILSRGYINDATRTAFAFIQDPAWLLRGFAWEAIPLAPCRYRRRPKLCRSVSRLAISSEKRPLLALPPAATRLSHPRRPQSPLAPTAEVNGETRALQTSTMQQLWLNVAGSDLTACFDQCFLLKPRLTVEFEQLARAVELLVARHAALQVRFRRTNGSWEQNLTGHAGSLAVHHVKDAGNDVPELISQF